MTKEEQNNTDTWKKEEIRGIFVLGTLATLLAARNLYVDATINLGTIPIPIVFFANYILFFWGIYVICITLSLSDEFLPPFVSELLISTGKAFFGLGSLFTVTLFSLFYIAGYIEKLWAIIVPIIPFLFLHIKKNINKLKEKYTIDVKNINLKKLTMQLSLIGFMIFYLYLFMNVVGSSFTTHTDLNVLVFFSFLFSLLTSLLHLLRTQT